MIAGWRRRFGLAFLFGIMPDLLSFGLLMAVRIIQGSYTPGKPALHTIPEWLYINYNFTHSLVIAGILWAFLWWRNRELAVPFSAWIIHIMMDIPTHNSRFFPTPFLWPLSDFTVEGFSWGQRWFMILNYSCLLVLALFFVAARERRRRKSKLTVSPAPQAELLSGSRSNSRST
ncbi:MAG: hypothetical protein U9P14_00815 [Gemmatimonadota bacterium]|nr:hypothetical protein [Gemmatimonadota bacterium]